MLCLLLLLCVVWFAVQLFLVLWKRRSYTLAFRWGVHKEGDKCFLCLTDWQAVVKMY